MFTLLAPALLAAAVALAVPILIHLWSRGEGTRVRVGSIRFLEATAAARARRLRLTRPGLLLVRLALLAALVLLLAEPARRGERPPDAPERWALVAPAVDADAPEMLERLAALEREGWTLRRLLPDVPPLDLDAPPAPRDTVVDAWSVLRAVDADLPPGSALTVVAPARLASARGARPALATPVTWQDAPDGATDAWIDEARALGDGRVAVIVGTDDGGTVRRGRVVVSGEAPTRDGIRLASDAVRLADGTGRRVTPPADSLRVVLVHDDARAEDAAYVRTAVEAASAHGLLAAAVSHRRPADPPAEADLVFWLGPSPPPDTLPGFAVIAGAGEAGDRTEGPLPAPDRLARRVVHPARFHPAHDPVVLDAAFPAWVLDLLRTARPEEAARVDRRRATVDQLTPRQADEAAETRRPEEAPLTPLRLPLWTIALGLFALERTLARRS